MSIIPKYADYIAMERLPHLWCPGCGHGVVLRCLAQALAELELPREKLVIASGIGCSGRIGDYVNTHRFQGTHGRTLAFATGIALARPDVHLIAIMGDGDCGAIGANHLIHAARRNINVTAIISNNFNYGMTGGQYSATTPLAGKSVTSPLGKPEEGEDLCALADVSGALYVARTTAFHVFEIIKLLKEAILIKGFSVLEVLSGCPTYYGKNNELGSGVDMMNWLKKSAVPAAKYQVMAEEEKAGRFATGVLLRRERPDFLTAYLARRADHDF